MQGAKQKVELMAAMTTCPGMKASTLSPSSQTLNFHIPAVFEAIVEDG